ESEYDRMRAPFQEGDFPFPVKYGYCFVGVVEEGPANRLGETCFALHPHQDRAALPPDAAVPLPQGLPARRAVLAANMETALNVAWDSTCGPGDKVLVVGGGVLGLLIAALLDRIPGTEVTLTDVNPNRRDAASALGLRFAAPEDAPGGMDIAVNASASGEGLRLALARAGLESRVVEASWHGRVSVDLPLGGAFHSQRLTLVSSQVGRIPSARAARWTHRRRMETALRLLAQMPALDALITHELAFEQAPAKLPALIETADDALCIVLHYGEERN
ncbi:MAG TPA: zinc-binding alcohol dehydrogenase, partial [Alphaproteobacteria bacterium]|nr:zinc-binding alcohol dehydrogenase [Alphaproteobacteria bacterium]